MTKILYAQNLNFIKLNINKTELEKKNVLKMLKVSYYEKKLNKA
jgi:hypothetical protein